METQHADIEACTCVDIPTVTDADAGGLEGALGLGMGLGVELELELELELLLTRRARGMASS